MFAKAFYHVPVIGWMTREAVEEGSTSLVLFLINLVLIWAIAILTFGYPAIIIPALCAVPTMFVALILITMG